MAGGRTRAFPSLRKLGFGGRISPLLLIPAGWCGAWSDPDRREPALLPIKGGHGTTGSSFANRVKCYPAGLMGEINDVMPVGQCSLVTRQWALAAGRPGLEPRSSTSNLCTFVQPTPSLRSLHHCKMRIIRPTLQGDCEKGIMQHSTWYMADTEQMAAIMIVPGSEKVHSL